MLFFSKFLKSSSKTLGSTMTPFPRMHFVPVSWTIPSGISLKPEPSGRIPGEIKDLLIKRDEKSLKARLTRFSCFASIKAAWIIIIRRQDMQKLILAFLSPLKSLDDTKLRLEASFAVCGLREHILHSFPHLFLFRRSMILAHLIASLLCVYNLIAAIEI